MARELLGRTERLTLRLTPDDAARLAHAAATRRVSQTAVLENLIRTLPEAPAHTAPQGDAGTAHKQH
jgi:uncharacterized protein (DUF1778 family)